MTRLPRVANDLLNFGRRNVPRIDPTNSPAIAMNLQHDLRRSLAVFVEMFLYDEHDEFHRREVVIQQDYLVHGRLFQLLLLPLNYSAVLFVGIDRHTSILNNSDRAAISPKPRPS